MISKLLSRLYSRRGYTDDVSPYDESEYERFIVQDREVLIKNIPQLLEPPEYLLNYPTIKNVYTAGLLQFCRTLTPAYTFYRKRVVYDVFRIPRYVRRDGYVHANPDMQYIKNAFGNEWNQNVQPYCLIGSTLFTCFIARKENTHRNIEYFRVLGGEPLGSDDSIYLFVPNVQGLTVDRNSREDIPEPVASSTLVECPICIESVPSNRMVKYTSCGHSTCPDCISGYINHQRNMNLPLCCPMCRKTIKNMTANNAATVAKVYFTTTN